jgi:hypothetical protein
VEISVVPGTSTTSYAVEEKVPYGWSVTNISNDGQYDVDAGCIRWGVFFDNSSRALTYTVTPPSNVSTVGNFTGNVSVDGDLQEITGAGGAQLSTGSVAVTLSNMRALQGEIVQLRITGAPGQSGVIEASSDLVNWTELGMVYLPDGVLEFSHAETGQTSIRFYRFRVK